MSKPAISVEKLGKMYRLSHKSRRADSFREAIASVALAPLRRMRQLSGRDESMEEFWALKDVSFEVQPGEVVGIIGRNGAGKSTLLKVLSRIVEPTEGRAVLRGRVASLLEVGTGFHPELSGRENIYLNGSILGMKKREIDSKFDEIVAFAEVEKFLDTPVKRYSSGMYVRLAFAVAAHLEPEILIVDEVLAVGDAEFQRKCLGKMQDVASKSGRTVLFVSHNMAAVRQLCTRAVWLRAGLVAADDSVEVALEAYLEGLERDAGAPLVQRSDRKGSGGVRLVEAQLRDSTDRPVGTLPAGAPARFAFEMSSWVRPVRVVFTLYGGAGAPVATFNGTSTITAAASGPKHVCVCDVPSLLLRPNHYRLNVAVMADAVLLDHVEAALLFTIESGPVDGHWVEPSNGYGDAYVPHSWNNELTENRR